MTEYEFAGRLIIAIVGIWLIYTGLRNFVDECALIKRLWKDRRGRVMVAVGAGVCVACVSILVAIGVACLMLAAWS